MKARNVTGAFFVMRHPVAGEIKFESVDDAIRISVSWPFDRSTGEWIRVQNTFPRKRYCAAIQRLAHANKVMIRATGFGKVVFVREPQLIFELTDWNPSMRTLFQFSLAGTVRDLTPR